MTKKPWWSDWKWYPLPLLLLSGLCVGAVMEPDVFWIALTLILAIIFGGSLVCFGAAIVHYLEEHRKW